MCWRSTSPFRNTSSFLRHHATTIQESNPKDLLVLKAPHGDNPQVHVWGGRGVGVEGSGGGDIRKTLWLTRPRGPSWWQNTWTIGLLDYFLWWNLNFTHPVSAAKPLFLAGSILHPAHCTVYGTLRPAPAPANAAECSLHTTHWTLYTAHYMFTLHFANVSLDTANIQNMPDLVPRFTWWNVPWHI